MKRDIILTGDGSHTISVAELKVAYHSVHGAIRESLHVYIDAGLYGLKPGQQSNSSRIFEVGFGTGLNALLTLIEAEKNTINVFYETVETSPLLQDEIKVLNYCEKLNRPELQPVFENLHNCEWDEQINISTHFTLSKRRANLINFSTTQLFNLIYFDAFAPNAQPELWTKEVFEKMFLVLGPGGILVTYCSKGDVRRAMMAAGFVVEKLKGPPGKREMLRATRPGPSQIHSD